MIHLIADTDNQPPVETQLGVLTRVEIELRVTRSALEPDSLTTETLTLIGVVGEPLCHP